MGWLSTIGRGLGALFGIGTQGSVAKEVADIVERWAPSEESKHMMEMDLMSRVQGAVASARQHDQPMNSGVPILDALVNGINRLIRPGVTVGLIGGICGWWPLPDPKTIEPMYFKYTEMVLVFWFGGRALFKDLPSVIKYLRKI